MGVTEEELGASGCVLGGPLESGHGAGPQLRPLAGFQALGAVLRIQSLGSHPGSPAYSLCDLASPSLGFDLCKVRVVTSDSKAVVALPEVTYVKHLTQGRAHRLRHLGQSHPGHLHQQGQATAVFVAAE